MIALISLLAVSVMFQDQAPMDAAALAELVERSQVLRSISFETEFEVRGLAARPYDEDATWDPNYPIELDAYRFVAVGDRFFAKRVSADLKTQSEDVFARPFYTQWSVWSDDVWYQQAEDFRPSMTLSARAYPPDPDSRGYSFNLMQGRLPAYLTLAELIADGTFIDQHVDDDVLTYRFAQRGERANMIQHVLKARLRPTFRLLQYAVEFSRAKRIEDFQHEKSHWGIFQWQEYQAFGDLDLPMAGELIITMPQDLADPNSLIIISKVLYRRTSFRRVEDDEIDPNLFTMPAPPGMVVYDQRLRLSYTIGGTSLHVDGRAFEVNEPILEHPGEGFHLLIDDAEVSGNAAPDASNDSSAKGAPEPFRPAESSSTWYRYRTMTIAGLVGVAVMLAAYAILRGRMASADGRHA